MGKAAESQGEITGDLDRRRTCRDAEATVGLIRQVLAVHDRGDLPLEACAWKLARLGNHFGVLVFRGELGVAS
jgi:hypothetical protein